MAFQILQPYNLRFPDFKYPDLSDVFAQVAAAYRSDKSGELLGQGIAAAGSALGKGIAGIPDQINQNKLTDARVAALQQNAMVKGAPVPAVTGFAPNNAYDKFGAGLSQPEATQVTAPASVPGPLTPTLQSSVANTQTAGLPLDIAVRPLPLGTPISMEAEQPFAPLTPSLEAGDTQLALGTELPPVDLSAIPNTPTAPANDLFARTVAEMQANGGRPVGRLTPTAKTANGSVFGLVPDGAGGVKNDPNDITDSNVPGFSATTGAWGANIKDPSLMGVAVNPKELAAAGVNLDDPSGHFVRVSANGKTLNLPIVDKLGKEGRLDLTLPAYRALGGPDEKNGGIISGMKYEILPNNSKPLTPGRIGSDVAAPSLTASTPQLAQTGPLRPEVKTLANGTKVILQNGVPISAMDPPRVDKAGRPVPMAPRAPSHAEMLLLNPAKKDAVTTIDDKINEKLALTGLDVASMNPAQKRDALRKLAKDSVEISEEEASLAEKIADYNMPISALSKIPAQAKVRILSAASTINPNFDAKEYGNRAAIRKDFTSGVGARNITAANTAIGHLSSLAKAGDKLNNGRFPKANAVKNWISTETGKSAVTEFESKKQAVVTELAKLFKGSGAPSLAEIEDWKQTIHPNMSPEQITGSIRSAVELMGSRLDAMNNQWIQSIKAPRDFSFLDKHSREILSKFGVDPKTVDPISVLEEETKQDENPADTPAPASAVVPNAPTVGEVRQGYKFKGGNPADRNSWEKVN